MTGEASLARLFREYGDRWDIEKIERSAEWVAVQRGSGGGYVRIVAGHDLGSLRYQMDQAEREEPEESERTAASVEIPN